MIKGDNAVVAPPSNLEVRTPVDWTPPHSAANRLSADRLLGLLELGKRHRDLLLKIVGCGILLSLAVAFLIPARYEAVARLMPPDQSGGVSARMIGALTAKAGDTVGGLARDLLGNQTTTATLVGILASNTVQDDLINRFDLRSVYFKKKYESARKVLTRRTDLLEDRRSGIITIRVEDADPRRAAAIAQGYVDELNSRVSQLTTSSAHRERVFLEARLQAIKKHLDESTLELSQFSSRNKTFDPQIEGKAMIEAAATLQGEMIVAQSELSGLQQVYGPENSHVRSASAKVAELQSKLRKLSGSSVKDPAATAASDASDARERSDAPYPSIEQLPLLGNT
jgi:uncharacterized protein involved in exopolysaccharide biosynthesis